MKTSCIFSAFLCVLLISTSFADETTIVIKVNGAYGIINRGSNQGIAEGQILVVKRRLADGLSLMGKARVIRTTANRAAIEQLPPKNRFKLQKDDMLFSGNELAADGKRRQRRGRKANSQQAARKSKARITPITEPQHQPEAVERRAPEPSTSRFATRRKPWVTLNAGAIMPSQGLSTAQSPSFKLGGSYLVPAGKGFNIGVEINKTFIQNSSFQNPGQGGFSKMSSSLLEAYVVLQKFIGSRFFVETGGGIYRPKLSVTSIDNVESTYSATNFGFFAGSGFFVPTSEYAGLMVKGRMHNYFGQFSKQFFGVMGGFRFRMR